MSRFRVALLFLTAFWLSSSLFAQIDRGVIKGLVTDPQGAIVVGAKVTLTNPATGSISTVETESNGTFTFVGLTAGQYQISCEASGFKKFVQDTVAVDVGRTTSIKVPLETGTLSESVTVKADAAMLDTDTSDVGTSVTRRQIMDLPVPLTADSRNPMSFVILTPGVSGSIPGATPDLRLHVSGSPTGSSEVYIDGIPAADTGTTGDVAANHPSLESIGEFKLSNNGQSAQYGLAAGIISFTFRSGTNTPHGSLFEYLQNDHLNAMDSPTKAIAARDGVEARKAPLKQNEYGFSFGAPVYIPKIYNGRDKTFFFANYTGFKYRPSSNSNTLTTLPNHLRDGDFSQLLGDQLMVDGSPLFDAAGRPIRAGQIYDPASTHTVIGPDGGSYQVRDPIPGNVIAPNDPRISGVSQQVVPLFPMATSDALFNNITRLTREQIDQEKFVIKLDQLIGSRHTLSGSYFRGINDFSNNGESNDLNDLSAFTRSSPSNQFRLNHTYMATPRIVNALTFGFLRDRLIEGPLDPAPPLSSLGIEGIGLAPGAPWPTFNVIGQNGIGGGPFSAVAQNRFIVTDTLNWSLGAHNLKIGGEFRRLQRNEVPGSGGAFDFRPPQTGQNGTGFINTASGPVAVSIPNGATGHSVASLLFGAVEYSRFDLGYTTAGYRWFTAAGYIQDDWKINRSLTLNIGLRYDYANPRSEILGRIATMNPNLLNPSAGNLRGAMDFYGDGPGRNGRNQFGQPNNLAFQPRVGLAYAPAATEGILGKLLGDQKTVFRTNFSLSRPLGNDNLTNGIGGGLYAPGFNGVAQVNRPQDSINSPAFYWDNGFPSFTPPPFIDPGMFVGNANPPYITREAGRLPTQINWSFGIQRALPGNLVFDATYVGMHTYHLGLWRKPNQIHPDMLRKLQSAASAAGVPVNEFFSLPIDDPRVTAAGITAPWSGFKDVFGDGATVSQALRPFPQYGNIDQMFEPIGNVTYNALQTKIQKRFSQGLTMLLSYTFSKTLGDVDSLNGAFAGAENAQFAASFQQNYYDERSEKSVTSSDIPHVVALSYTYELPFGPGKPLANKGGIVGQLVGGWQVSGIHLYQSGRPVHIENWAFGSDNPLRANDGFSVRPDIVPGQPLVNPEWNKNCSGPLSNDPGRSACQFYFNPAAFTAPAPGTFGNAPKFLSGLRMRPYFNEDFSITKRFPLTERVNLAFQANFFNAFNRVVQGSGGAQTFQFPFAPSDLSSASLANSTTAFGILTAQQNAPRRIQFALRLDF